MLNGCGDMEDIDDINIGLVLKDVANMFKFAFDRGNDFSIYVMMDEWVKLLKPRFLENQ